MENRVEILEEQKESQGKEIDDLEQYSKRNCLLLHGVVETNAECTNDIIIKTCTEELGNDVKQEDLDLNISSLNSEEMLSCEGNLTEQEIYKLLTSFKNNKSPGNDGLTKEFYWCFWNDIKDIFMKSLCESKKLKQLCVSQRQAIIKLLEKPNKKKLYKK